MDANDENAAQVLPKLHRNHGKPCRACQQPLKTGCIRGGGEYCAGNKCREAAEDDGAVKKRPRKGLGAAVVHPQAAMLEGRRFASGGGPRQDLGREPLGRRRARRL